MCGTGQSDGFAGTTWVARGSTPPQIHVDPAALAQLAKQRVPVREPTIEMNPSTAQDQLVALLTWLWIDAPEWSPVTAHAEAGPVSSTVTATPKEVIWRM